MLEAIRRHARIVARFLQAQSPEERENRAASTFALLAVCLVAVARYVSGVTLDGAPFTLFTVAVAASAARGGMVGGVVAALASILLAGLGADPPLDLRARLVFAAEAGCIALIVSGIGARLRLRDGWLGTAGATIAGLRLREQRARLLDAALEQVEGAGDDMAVVLLDDQGTIAEWRPSAERLYGYRAQDVLGASGASLFFETLSPEEWRALLCLSRRTGVVRGPEAHRRADGSRIEAEIELKPFREGDAQAFTLTVHDTARGREWDEYRQAAARAQAALRDAADHARQQLAALESLTDPSLNPLGGPEMVTELLDRLRAAIRGDGAALVERGRGGIGVTAAHGLEPQALLTASEGVALAPGRVAVVHNDPARVAQLSAVRWPAGASSLLAVPVVHDGQVWSRIEVASERSRQVSDWDVALARVVADRLAAVVVQDHALPAKAS